MRFLLFFLLTQIILGLYLGWRFRWAFGALLPSWLTPHYVYWPIVVIVVMSFMLTLFIERNTGSEAPAWWLFTASLLFGTLALAFTTVLIVDVVAFIARRLPVLHSICAYFRQNPHYLGLTVLAIIFTQVAYGYYQAHTPRETHYALHIDKPLRNDISQLRIVQISDLHINRVTSVPAMQALVARVNALSPDLVFFTGDIVDNTIKPYLDKNLPQLFSTLDSRYGVYAILGNHEYYGESPLLDIDAYRHSNMHILRDEAHYLENPGITLIGRDDWGRGSGFSDDSPDPLSRLARAPLADLMTNVDPRTPLILLDHQPRDIDEAIEQKIDLQFSGHTHNGQFFPINFIVKNMYRKVWGLLEEGPYRLIVSCGFGTWGPPLRMPSHAEIVVTDLRFPSSPVQP